MKNQFVSYEIALKLKELGFDEQCFAIWGKNPSNNYIEEVYQGSWNNLKSQEDAKTLYHGILAPLWQQVIDWLFLKGVAVQFWFNSNTMCWCTEDVFNHNTGKLSVCEYLEKPSLYEIREQAILKAIELITPKQ